MSNLKYFLITYDVVLVQYIQEWTRDLYSWHIGDPQSVLVALMNKYSFWVKVSMLGMVQNTGQMTINPSLKVLAIKMVAVNVQRANKVSRGSTQEKKVWCKKCV